MSNTYIHKIDLTKSPSTITLGQTIYPGATLYPSATLYPGGVSFIDTVNPNWFDLDPYDPGYVPGADFTKYAIFSKIQLPQWYPHVGQEIGTPKDKILIKKVVIEGEGRFDAEVYRKDYKITITKSHEETSIKDLDLHVNSRVDRCELSVSDDSDKDFRIKSFVIEGLFSPTSKTLR